MEILELNLKHFGRFTEYKLPLHAGINVISGGNETGKSTLHAFVRAMFYGLSRNRSRNLDEYQLREPWDNPAYFAGSMRILYDQKIYRIERNFYRRDESLRVICETTGTQLQDPEAALAAFTAGLSEQDFDNTLFIRQAQPETSAQLGEHIRDFLVNLEETGNTSMDVSAAQDFLKKKRKQTESEKAAQLSKVEEEIRENLQESEYLNRDLERLLEKSAAGPEDAGTRPFERIDAKEQQEQQEQAPPPSVSSETKCVEVERARAVREEEEAAEEAPEEDSEPGGLLLSVLVMLSFVAAGLAVVCAFLTTDHRMRYVLAGGGVLFLIIALSLLWRITHPVSRTEKAIRRAKYGEFLDRHLGFREDPDDPLSREDQLRRQRRMQEKVDRARQMDREEEERREENRRMLLEKTLREQEEEERQKRAREVAEIAAKSRDGRQDVLNREISTRRERIDALKEELEKLYAKKSSLTSYDTQLQAIDLASSRIRELSGKIYHESGDEFMETVSSMIAGLTEGRYGRISLDERMQVKINTPERLLSIEQVGCGTMHQIYFALRLCSASLLSGGADLPILLDETFAMYDDERMESALRYLSGTGRQVLLFSCQRRELEALARIRGKAT